MATKKQVKRAPKKKTTASTPVPASVPAPVLMAVDTQPKLVFSYLTLRKAVGYLGMALPIAVALGAWIIFGTGLQGSLSGYFYTGMRGVFVGTLWAIGFFLFSYQGYERRDFVAGRIAWLAALGVSLFPTTPDGPVTDVQARIGMVHYIFASIFFLTIIYFAYFLFTQTDPTQPPTRKKLQRNVVYRVCGIVMLICMILAALYTFLPASISGIFTPYHPIFWCETIAIEAFGISWAIKGEVLLKD